MVFPLQIDFPQLFFLMTPKERNGFSAALLLCCKACVAVQTIFKFVFKNAFVLSEKTNKETEEESHKRDNSMSFSAPMWTQVMWDVSSYSGGYALL